MNDMEIIREAIWKTSHEFGCNGDHDSNLIADAFKSLVMNIEQMIAQSRKDAE